MEPDSIGRVNRRTTLEVERDDSRRQKLQLVPATKRLAVCAYVRFIQLVDADAQQRRTVRKVGLLETKAHPMQDVYERFEVVPYFVLEAAWICEEHSRYEWPSALRRS